MVTLVLPEKLKRPKEMVADALTPLVAVAAGVSVGATVVADVSVGAALVGGVEDVEPQAASVSATHSKNKLASFRMGNP